jgi:hypothetical protein
MQDWKKYIEGVADKKIEHNINISVVNEQARVLKEAVLEVLQELSPNLIPVFVDKLDIKTKQLNGESIGHIQGEVIDVS